MKWRSFIWLPSLLLAGCMVKKEVKMMVPAELSLPPHIQAIVIGHCTRTGEPDPWFGNSDALKGQGLAEGAKGLYASLQNAPRFQVRENIVNLGKARNQMFGDPLDWNKVQEICEANNADALIALEVIDINNRSIRRVREITTTDLEGRVITVPEIEIEEIVNVSIGWRIYDPTSKKLLDEQTRDIEESYYGKGYTDGEARYNLPHQQDMVIQTSYLAGQYYAQHIAPSWATVKRGFYGKYKEERDMEIAMVLAEGGNWKKAAERWKGIVYKTKDSKLAGRAAYNMAVACEMEGALEAAKQWAQKSIEFKNKKAKRYLEMIEERIENEQKLAEQLQGQE